MKNLHKKNKVNILLFILILLLLLNKNHSNKNDISISSKFNIKTSQTLSTPTITWNQTYNRSSCDSFFSGIEVSKNELLLIGTTKNRDTVEDVWLVKTDPNGNLLWEKTYGSNTVDIGFSVIQTSDDYFILAGYTYLNGSADGWLIKTDSEGEHIWNKTYGELGEEVINSVIETNDGGYCLAGFTSSVAYGADFFDGWIVRTDCNGEFLWSRNYGSSEWDEFESIIQTPDGGYLLAGTLASGLLPNPDQFWILKTDNLGNHEWNLTLGSSIWNDDAYSVIQTADGGYAIVGRTTVRTSEITINSWLVKIDSNGAIEWNKTYGTLANEKAQSIIQLKDGGFALLGNTEFYNVSSFDFWLIRTDHLGNELWNQTYGTINPDSPHKILQTQDEGLILIGDTFGSTFEALVYKIGGELHPSSSSTPFFTNTFLLLFPFLVLYLFLLKKRKRAT